MECKEISSNLHKTRVLIVRLDLRPSSIFFPTSNLDNQPSYNKGALIGYECCLKTFYPTSLRGMHPQRGWHKTSLSSVIGCKRKLGSAGRLLSPGAFLGSEIGIQPGIGSLFPEQVLDVGRPTAAILGSQRRTRDTFPPQGVSLKFIHGPWNSSMVPEIHPQSLKSHQLQSFLGEYAPIRRHTRLERCCLYP